MLLCPFCGGDGVIVARSGKRTRQAKRQTMPPFQHESGSSEDVSAGATVAVTGHIQGSHQTPPAPRPCTRCRGIGLVVDAHTDVSNDSQDAQPLGHPAQRLGCPHCMKEGTPDIGAELRPLAKTVGVAVIGGGIGGLAAAIALRARGIDVVVYERDAGFFERRQGYGLTMQQGARVLQQLGVSVQGGIVSTAHFSLSPTGDLLGCYGRDVYYRGADTTNGSASISTSAIDSTNAEAGHDTNGAAAADDGERVATLAKPVLVGGDVTAAAAVDAPASESTSLSGIDGHRRPPDRRHNVHVPRQALRRVLLDALPPDVICWGHRLTSFSENDEGVTIHFDGGREVMDLYIYSPRSTRFVLDTVILSACFLF